MRISGETMEKVLANIDVFVSADIETTGFSPNKGAEILEIGAAMINSRTKKVIKTFSKMIKPRNGKISAKITEVTNITNEMVENAEFLESVLKEFNEFIGDYPIVFHNANFDWDRFLDPIFKKQGIYKNNHIIDTLPLTKVCIPNLKKRNLGDICNHFGYEIKNQHRALADAKATGALAVKYKEILISKYESINIDEFSSNNHENSLPEFKIKSINCWEKAKHKNIYILTSWGNLFYDLNKKDWFVANTQFEASIDFNIVEANFLRIINLKSINEIEKFFNEKIEKKVS